MNEEAIPDKSIVDNRRPWRLATIHMVVALRRHHAGQVAERGRRGVESSNPLESERNGAKVTDFGVARYFGETFANSITQHPSSAAYMSPERCRGMQLDGRSDLYVLTCFYYQMLTGDYPFKATDVATMKHEHCHAPFPDARLKAPDLPDGVIRILARGSQKDPADRYQTAGEMAADLMTLLQSPDSSGN